MSNTVLNNLPGNTNSILPPAAIAGSYQTGVLAVRSLKKRGVNVLSFDCDPSFPGFRSVYGRALLCADPDRHPDEWLDFMIKLSGKFNEKSALIPSSDRFVSAIACHSDILKDHYIISPGIKLQGLLADKKSQYELAERQCMPMPLTKFVKSVDEIRKFAQEAIFPCLIKPTHFREWHKFTVEHPLHGVKISIARTKQELIDNYTLASAVNPNVLVQEIIQGNDLAKRVYLSCYNKNQERIAHALFRELRCDPMGFGPATVTEPVEDHEVDEICDRFLRNLKYTGLCEIEMKWDERDGKAKLIEANPRLSGGGDAAPYAGVDLPWIHYLDLIGRGGKPVVPNGKKFKHVVLRSDAKAIPVYWKAGLLSWRDILNSYRPPLAFFDFDIKDLRYSVETIYVFIRSLLRGIFSNTSNQGSV